MTLQQAARLVKAKPTNIDLVLDRANRRDRMVTKYGIDFQALRDQLSADVESLKGHGFTSIRSKIEKVLDEIPDFSLENVEEGGVLYYEFHVKSGRQFQSVPGFVTSSNPSELGTVFYNTRVPPDGSNLEDLKAAIAGIQDVIEVQSEVVLFDSNAHFDTGWAPIKRQQYGSSHVI